MVQYTLEDKDDWIQLCSAWDRTVERIASNINTAWIERFVMPLKPKKLEGDTAVIAAPGKFVSEWVQDRLLGNMESILSDELGRTVKIHLVTEARERSSVPASAAVTMHSMPDQPRFKAQEKFSFESFVVGQSNRLAFAGAKAVASAPGAKYNPLFIYGASGLGKTHLLHAIARELTARHPEVGVAYVSAQQFSEEFVHAVQTGRIDAFRRSQRNVGIWLMDDIQFVAGRDRTQEEVFHTFNHLQSLGKQIVLTSDRPPRELQLMDERLRSRFECGLVADIQSPDTETRCAIVLSKAAHESISLDVSTAMVLAESVPGNIRNLEGALTRLVAEASMQNAELDEALAHQLVDKYYRDGMQPKPGFVQIIESVSVYFKVPEEEIKGVKRHAPIVQARHVAVYLTREITGESWKRIGALFGDRDHTSMMHGYQRIHEQLHRDRELRSAVKSLLRQLKPSE